MGLRAYSLVWVLGFTLGVGGAGVAALDRYMSRSFEALETRAMAHDLQRLRATLAEAVQQRGRAAREWGSWSELREHVLQPRPAFAAENLSPDSVRTSGLAWLGLLDLQGRWLHRVAAQPDSAADAVAAQLTEPAQGGNPALATPSEAGRCGLARLAALGPELLVLCQVPVRDSGGHTPPVGNLLTLERLSQPWLQALGASAALDFELLPLQPPGPPWQPLASLDTLRGEGQLWLLAGEREHRLRWQLQGLSGAPVAWVELRWLRELRLQTTEVLRGTRALVALLALLLALGALVFVEWRLVRRLRALRLQMAQARERQDWTPRLRASGHDEISELAAEGNHLLGVIQAQLQTLEQHAQTDPLTGLANRRAFDPTLRHALARSARNGTPLCLLMLDADHFKRFNDRHGHAAGDLALQTLARSLQAVERAGVDLAARLGGEEFALLLEGLALGEAEALVESLRGAVAALPHGPGQALAQALTVSIGLAQARPGEGAADLLARADAALYRAKQEGRNRVSCSAQ